MPKRVVTDTDIGSTLEIDGGNLLQNKVATVAEALAGTDTEHSISPSVLMNGAVIEQIQSNAWEQQPDASAAQIAALSDNDEVLVKTASGDILQFRLGDIFTLDVSVIEGALTDVVAAGTDIVVNTDLSEASVATPNRTDFVVGSTVGATNYKVTWDDALTAMAATATERGSVELATAAEVLAGTDAERAVTPDTLNDVLPRQYFTSAPGDIPAAPVAGSTLVDDAGNGNMFVRFNDGTSDIWLDVSD